MYEALLLVLLAANAFILICVTRYHRMFVGVLLFSHAYFCLAGLLYWVYVRDTAFVGVYWGEDELYRAALVLSTATVWVAVCVLTCSLLTSKAGPVIDATISDKDYEPPLGIMLAIGLTACLFVLAESLTGASVGTVDQSPIFLIAYQFSDFLIPAILFRIAMFGLTFWNVLLSAFFLSFAAFVGLRYKIAMLLLPLLLVFVFGRHRLPTKIAVSVGASACVLSLFSLMTLYRSKFGGIDFDRVNYDNSRDLVYGLFAEANLLFGMVSVLSNYVDQGVTYFWQPIADAFRDWIPRFLIEEKNTGQYLLLMQQGLKTDEGFQSGTTLPFVGEFAIMAGWVGIAVGSTMFAGLYLWIYSYLRRRARSRDIFVAGVALTASVMGYYHYSRGYTSQALKGYMFLIVPYLFLCSFGGIYKRRDGRVETVVDDGESIGRGSLCKGSERRAGVV